MIKALMTNREVRNLYDSDFIWSPDTRRHRVQGLRIDLVRRSA
jgi:Ni,Fe-hydrogenase III component G